MLTYATKMENKRKDYVICDNTSSDDVFAILDAVGSHYESDIDNMMTDSDTEFIIDGEEPPRQADAAKSKSDGNALLISEANVHYIYYQ